MHSKGRGIGIPCFTCINASNSQSGGPSDQLFGEQSRSIASSSSSAENDTLYGPFHRRESPTNGAIVSALIVATGELWGTVPQYGLTPTVQAFVGPLPAGMFGVEFYTSVAPASGTSPWEARWYRGMPGVTATPLSDYVRIPIKASNWKIFE